jgi:hypothetical protein
VGSAIIKLKKTKNKKNNFVFLIARIIRRTRTRKLTMCLKQNKQTKKHYSKLDIN